MTTETKNKGGRPRIHEVPNEMRVRDWEQAKEDFLEGYQKYGTLKGGCEVGRVTGKTVTVWEREDEEFRLRWKSMRDDIADELEGKILWLARRLDTGDMDRGERRNCLSAAIFLLKAAKPDKFRENFRYQQFRMQKAEESALRNKTDQELTDLLADLPSGGTGGDGEEKA